MLVFSTQAYLFIFALVAAAAPSEEPTQQPSAAGQVEAAAVVGAPALAARSCSERAACR